MNRLLLKLIAITTVAIALSVKTPAQTPPNEPSRLRFMLTGSPYKQRTHGHCPVCGRPPAAEPCPCIIQPGQLTFWQNAGFLLGSGVYGVQPGAVVPAEPVMAGPVAVVPPGQAVPVTPPSTYGTAYAAPGYGYGAPVYGGTEYGYGYGVPAQGTYGQGPYGQGTYGQGPYPTPYLPQQQQQQQRHASQSTASQDSRQSADGTSGTSSQTRPPRQSSSVNDREDRDELERRSGLGDTTERRESYQDRFTSFASGGMGYGCESFGDAFGPGLSTGVSGQGRVIYTGANGIFTPPDNHTTDSTWDFTVYSPTGELVGSKPTTTIDSQTHVQFSQANGSGDPYSAQGTFQQGYLSTQSTERGNTWRVYNSENTVDGNFNPQGPSELYYIVSRTAISEQQAFDTQKYDCKNVYFDPATQLYYFQLTAAPNDSENKTLDATGRTLQDIVASTVPGTVTFIANESYIDSSDGTAQFVYDYEIPEIAFAPNVLGRVKITENMSPIPRTRFILDYNFFSDVPVTNGKANVNRLTPGVEWAFLKDNRASFEMRVPVGWTANCYQALDGAGRDDTGTIGDITLYLKILLRKTQRFAMSAGMGVSLPTGKNRGFTNGEFPSRNMFELENNTVHLMPYFGILYAPDNTVFAQAYAQVDISACESNVMFYDYVNTGSMRKFGTWDECTYIYLSGILGRWLYRDTTKRYGLTGLNVSAELHYTASLGDPKDVTGRFLSADQQSIENITIARRKNESYLNLTLGTHMLINQKNNVGFAISVPLFEQKQFTYETRITWNRYF